MSTRRTPPPAADAPPWDCPEPGRRPPPAPLSRDAIVDAAISIADAQGLDAVSIRKVAAALDAGPMRLYGYVTTKQELLALMADAVYAEMSAPRGKDWRATLRSSARRLRDAGRRHPWFAALMGGRPQQGPSALAHLEAMLAALDGSPGCAHIDAALQGAMTLNAYVIGALQAEANERRAEVESGQDKRAWQAATGPTLQKLVETGKFPTLAKVMREATHPGADEAFERGLELVLDGIAGGGAPVPASRRART